MPAVALHSVKVQFAGFATLFRVARANRRRWLVQG
jgi:hypothetical protein